MTWSNILRMIESGQITLYEISDGIEINIESNNETTVRKKNHTEASQDIIENIKKISQKIDKTKLPSRLILAGPNCSSLANIKNFHLIIDPEQKKLIHDFENTLPDVKIVQALQASKPDTKKLSGSFKKIKNLKMRQTIAEYIFAAIDRMKIFTHEEKEFFEKVLRSKIDGTDLEISTDIRNDMQTRRKLQRIVSNFWIYLEEVMLPVYSAVRKSLMSRVSGDPPGWFYDARAEISARNAKMNLLVSKALKKDKNEANNLLAMYGLCSKDQNLISTLGLQVLFICKEKNLRVNLPLVVGLELRLRQIIGAS